MWSRERSASGFPPQSVTCARCGGTGPLKLEAATLRGLPALGPFVRFCSVQCFRANWHQLRDLQAWALAASTSDERRREAGAENLGGCAASTASNTTTEPVSSSSIHQRVVLGRGERYIPKIADIGKRQHFFCPIYSLSQITRISNCHE